MGSKSGIDKLTYPDEDSLAVKVDVSNSKLVREGHFVER